MVRPVWPSLYFWYFLGLFSSFVWFSIVASMIFRSRKDENLGDVVYPSATYLPWYFGNFAIWTFFQWLLSNPNKDHIFPGYERIGKVIGVALLFIGNILVYYLTEKSVALMLFFLFVAISFLSTLLPPTLHGFRSSGLSGHCIFEPGFDSFRAPIGLFYLLALSWRHSGICESRQKLLEGEKQVVKSKVERWKLFKSDRTHDRTHQN